MNDSSNKTGCFGMLFGWLASPPSRGAAVPVHYPYGKRKFLSAAELTFFRVLKNQLPPEWHLVTKVNLADLFFVRQPHRNQAARNRIDRKHVDFVICDAGQCSRCWRSNWMIPATSGRTGSRGINLSTGCLKRRGCRSCM